MELNPLFWSSFGLFAKLEMPLDGDLGIARWMRGIVVDHAIETAIALQYLTAS